MDTLGILVWDENRDFNQLNVKDMSDLVRRDRNHPSVVIWSACNEIECWLQGPANVTGKLMHDAVKRWDTTRPFSANQNQLTFPIGSNLTNTFLSKYLDVEGFSHKSIMKAGPIHAANPDKAIVSSECCSCRTQRGEDYSDSASGVTFIKNLDQAVCMQTCMNYSYPFVPGNPSPIYGVTAGTLGVWTLFDYGGEPGNWPQVSSSFGQFDIAGFAKSSSFWYRANWLAAVPASDPGRPLIPHKNIVRISQSWTPPQRPSFPPQPPNLHCDYTLFEQLCPMHVAPVTNSELARCMACAKGHGKALIKAGCAGVNVWPNYCRGEGPHFANVSVPVEVQVFSNLPQVQLLLNGKSLGQQPVTPFGFASFTNLSYAPGNLTAVGFFTDTASSGDNDEYGAITTMASHTIITPGPAAAIVLSVDCPSPATGTGNALLADGHDAALVRATVVDAHGYLVKNASHLITFTVTRGPGRIIGVHNGDAKSHEPQASNLRHAYHGLARAVVGVTIDALSPPIAARIDAEHGDGIGTVALTDPTSASDIIVTATTPGLGPGTVRVFVSTNATRDAPLAAARRHVHSSLDF